MPLPFWTTCLNFNRSCRRLVQRYYLRLPSVLSDTTSLAVPPRCNRTIQFPIVPEHGERKAIERSLPEHKNPRCLKEILKDLRTTENFMDEFWAPFRRCNLEICLLFFAEICDVDSSTRWSLTEIAVVNLARFQLFRLTYFLADYRGARRFYRRIYVCLS